MPDLPNVGFERDIEGFIVSILANSVSRMYIILTWLLQEFFENPAFRADGLKVYPTLVIRGTGREDHDKDNNAKLFNVDVCRSL